jgi:hypothetical protein
VAITRRHALVAIATYRGGAACRAVVDARQFRIFYAGAEAHGVHNPLTPELSARLLIYYSKRRIHQKTRADDRQCKYLYESDQKPSHCHLLTVSLLRTLSKRSHSKNIRPKYFFELAIGATAVSSKIPAVTSTARGVWLHGRNGQECSHRATEAFQFPEIVLQR